jgi:hypothetical protein
MNKKFDYDALERAYIQGDMSLRELAETVGMKNHSLIMRQSKKREWARKRQEYRDRADETALTVMADKRGNYLAREAAVKDNVVGAIDDMVTRLREDLTKTKTVIVNGVPEQQPLVRVTPNHIGMLIDKVQVIFGKPSTITEDRTFGATVTGEADPDLLRRFVEATRGVGLDSGPTAESPLPVAPEPRED